MHCLKSWKMVSLLFFDGWLTDIVCCSKGTVLKSHMISSNDDITIHTTIIFRGRSAIKYEGTIHVCIYMHTCHFIWHIDFWILFHPSAFRKFWKEWSVVMVDNNTTSQYPIKNTRATMQPPPFQIGRKFFPNATILTVPSSCFLPCTTCRCYHSNASILMLTSQHCNPVATIPPLPSQCYWPATLSLNSFVPTLPSCPHATILSPCCHIILMQPFHHQSTISSTHYHAVPRSYAQ